MMTIYMVRHAESLESKTKFGCDDGQLGKNFYKQVNKLKNNLSKLELDICLTPENDDISFWTFMEATPQLNCVPSYIAPELRDRNYGDFDGVLKKDYKKFIQKNYNGVDILNESVFTLNDGESLMQVEARVRPFYESLFRDNLLDENIFLFTYNPVMQALGVISGLYDGWQKAKNIQHKYCQIIELPQHKKSDE